MTEQHTALEEMSLTFSGVLKKKEFYLIFDLIDKMKINGWKSETRQIEELDGSLVKINYIIKQ